jgi:3-phenylpropionate/trans-cinnamate dioxygenase ferredoxin reductase component
MTAPENVVIVGAGLAGAKTAEALRDAGYEGRLTLLGAERHLPYERPPLSKGYLGGAAERDTVFVHDRGWYGEREVSLRLGVSVTGVVRADRAVVLADGQEVAYDRLVFATGASPRRLPIPGADAIGVHYLRTLDDCDAMRTVLATGGRLVVIGAGWIGMEVAATAREAGLDVTVIEALELPLVRVLGPEIGAVFADLHRERGVDLRLATAIDEIVVKDGVACGVRLRDGSLVDADAVLVAVGVAPNTALAESSGLRVENGIVVDETLSTRDPDVLAVGDVARAFHPLLGRHVRVEHWANALNQPAVAAATILGWRTAYDRLPYFFTDQFDLGMEYVGHADPGEYDKVIVRGDPGRREFVAFWLAGGRVLAGMNVNVWDVGDAIRALIRERGPIDPERLADSAIPLEAV